MKTNKSFEIKAPHFSYESKEDFLYQKNIPKEINNFNTSKNKKNQNYELTFFNSKFSNQKNLISPLNTTISYKVKETYAEKEAINLQNYFFPLKSSTTILYEVVTSVAKW